MSSTEDRPISLRPALRRGAAPLLVLRVLSQGPRHGYGISQGISELFLGNYEPSPGMVYPTLQSLEDQGLVRGERSAGRVVYTITDAGRAHLARARPEVERLLSGAAEADPARPIARSAERLRRTILLFLPEMTADQRRRVAAWLDDVRARVARMVEGS